MKYFICLLSILAAVHCDTLKRGFRARYGRGGEEAADSSCFFDLPQNVTEAVSLGWTETPRPDGPFSSLVMYCPDYPAICILFDDTNNAAGAQVAINKAKVTDQVLDWSMQGFVNWTTADGSEYWTQHQYYVTEEYLAKSAEERLASRKEGVLQLDSIWVTALNGELLEIPTSRDEIEKTMYTKQGCYTQMGQHYFYNMSETVECNSEQMFPWFLTASSDTLIGSVCATTGIYSLESDERNWYDAIGTEAVLRTIIPHGPECFYKLDIVTMHIYYVEEPWGITCPPQ